MSCQHCAQHGGDLKTHHIKPFNIIFFEFIRDAYSGNIENLYNGDTHNPKEHVYQIAYDYDGKEGVVYLGKNLPDNVTDLKKLFPKFFSEYFDKNKGSQESITELLKHPNTDIGIEEFINIIKQAKQDNAFFSPKQGLLLSQRVGTARPYFA